jgi:hypothetical protein
MAEDDSPKEVVETLVSAVAAAVDTGLFSAGEAALDAVAPGLGTRLLGWAVDAKRRRDQRKFDDWMAQVVARLRHRGIPSAEELVRGHIDEPWAHDAVIRAARAILEDLDEAILPTLARVTAIQIEERRVDRRTRRLIAMLGECDFEMLAKLRRVLRACAAAFGDGTDDSVEVAVEPSPGGFRAIHASAPGRAVLHGAGWLPVVGTLRRFGFLEDALPGLADRDPGDVVLLCLRDDFDYLVRRIG